MSKWKQTSIGAFIDFNPSESVKKGVIIKKIGMDKLGTFQRRINGYELSEYSNGPKFRNEDTLVAKITPCLENGKTAYVDILDENEVAFGSSEFIVLRKNENSDSKFIYYLARSPLFRERAISCMEGTSGRKRVNEGALKRQEILVPLVCEQQKIASVLSALDDKIELNNKINTELEQMAKTLYDYWFVQFDFPNEEGKPYKSSSGKMVYNEVLKREIPEGWEVKRLGKTLKTYLGGTPSTTNDNFWNGEIPWMNSGEVSNFPLITTEQKITTEAIENSSTRYLKKGSVLLSITRHLRVNILAIDACINQSIAGIEENKSFKNSYVYFSILNDIDRLMKLRTGAQQPHINKAIVDSSPFIIPIHSILEDYYSKIDPVIERIIINAKQNQELAELRDWLLPMLMNGQVTVGDVVEKEVGDYQTIVDSVFGTSNKVQSIHNSDLEDAALVYLMKSNLGYSYGEVALQKAKYNSSYMTPNLYSKQYAFKNYHFGTYSDELKVDLQMNPYLIRKKENGKEVFVVNPSKEKEILDVIANKENKGFVTAINELMQIYSLPFIGKKTDMMELFNTVLKIYADLKTTDINIIYKSMFDWKIKQTGFKTKAEKFSKEDTEKMIELLLSRGVIK